MDAAANLSEAALEALRERDFSIYDAATVELQKHGLLHLDYDWNVDDGNGGDEYEVWTLTPLGERVAATLPPAEGE